MNTKDLFPIDRFQIVNETDDKEVECVYCADLLSWAMGRAPAGCAWCTVMGNVNAVAVASLADVSILILCEGAVFDDTAVERAKQQDIFLVKTDLPAFEAAVIIGKKIDLPVFH